MYCNHTMKSGQTCKCPALRGEMVCLFHSKSDRAKAALAAHRTAGKSISRTQLLREVCRDFKAEKDPSLRATQAALIKQILDDRDMIADLKKIVKDRGLR